MAERLRTIVFPPENDQGIQFTADPIINWAHIVPAHLPPAMPGNSTFYLWGEMLFTAILMTYRWGIRNPHGAISPNVEIRARFDLAVGRHRSGRICTIVVVIYDPTRHSIVSAYPE